MNIPIQQQRNRSVYVNNTVILFIVIVCLSSFCSDVECFHLSMVASSRPSIRRAATTTAPAALSRPFGVMPPKIGTGLTGGLISQLAVLALKARLKAQTNVSCDVTASSTDLILRGACGPVTVRGRGWKSGLGLTCRAIEATVESAELDTGRIISDQKLVLRNPAKGRAMIALDGNDFSNFISHPLMKPPVVDGLEGDDSNGMEFIKDGVSIDASRRIITFYAKFQNKKWCCKLRRGASIDNRALIQVSSTDDGTDNSSLIASKMEESLSNFFNHMVFELDGTFLTFRDLMITDKGRSPSIMLSLNILVKKFPSRNLAF